MHFAIAARQAQSYVHSHSNDHSTWKIENLNSSWPFEAAATRHMCRVQWCSTTPSMPHTPALCTYVQYIYLFCTCDCFLSLHVVSHLIRVKRNSPSQPKWPLLLFPPLSLPFSLCAALPDTPSAISWPPWWGWVRVAYLQAWSLTWEDKMSSTTLLLSCRPWGRQWWKWRLDDVERPTLLLSTC